MSTYIEYSRLILGEIQASLARVDIEQVQQLTDAILQANTVFLMGTGRTFLSLQAFCKRLNHLGIAAHCIGDTNEPAATPRDLLIVGSGSGESVCPVAIARKAVAMGIRVVYIGSGAKSSLQDIADINVRIPVQIKADLCDGIPSKQIMGSLFEQCLYLLCDTITLMIASRLELDPKELWRNHANLE